MGESILCSKFCEFIAGKLRTVVSENDIRYPLCSEDKFDLLNNCKAGKFAQKFHLHPPGVVINNE